MSTDKTCNPERRRSENAISAFDSNFIIQSPGRFTKQSQMRRPFLPPRVLKSLLGFNDGPWRWSAGVGGGVAMGVPLSAFMLAGHPSLGLITSLGAFTALYGSTLRLGDRLQALPFVAAGFVAASTLGVLCATNAWLTIACLVAVAALASIILLGVGMGPPGPMQFVLVAGVSGHLAASARFSGSPLGVFMIPSLVAVGALSAYLLVIAPLALPLVHQRKGEASSLRMRFPPSLLDGEKATIAARVIVAVASAGLLSLSFGEHRAYWTVMVAGAVLQGSHVSRSSAIRAVHRVVGTVLGAAVFGLIQLVDPKGLWLVGVLALLQFAIEVVAARHYALALTFITPTALTISAVGGTSAPLALVGERIVDTFLGAVIAMVVLLGSECVRGRRAR
ncbi:FUSC family protein [Paraburkholderia tuberum]|nr:FUSC family protein [Paraburkholderia tuberum]